jgi:hypothetical protein
VKAADEDSQAEETVHPHSAMRLRSPALPTIPETIGEPIVTVIETSAIDAHRRLVVRLLETPGISHSI